MSREAIADSIEGRLNQLIEAWTLAVRNDPRIESDANLSKPELVDHVPAMVQEICELIRNDETPDVRNSHEARVNVYTRFNQGYKGRDLVGELSLLRITMLDYLMGVSLDESTRISADDRARSAMILNLYLDEEMRYAISVYSSQPTDSQPKAGS
ncbi:MAG: RsbRD N-terminal domain-containing protein [Blastocatellia bacterium]